MRIIEILCMLGIPGFLFGMMKWIFHQIGGIKKGVQALLRAQMIADYNKYKEMGYAPIYAKENFENCWQQYHALGVNGVMDGLHTEFLNLPTKPR
ncbi:MAG: hypothetical protein IJA86_06595 [Clostridia bacterium]|nr:hypothetical protein [Clostridia bacterium]